MHFLKKKSDATVQFLDDATDATLATICGTARRGAARLQLEFLLETLVEI